VATEKKEVGQDNYRTRCNYFRQSSDTFWIILFSVYTHWNVTY
jgi:hypothetical protein